MKKYGWCWEPKHKEEDLPLSFKEWVVAFVVGFLVYAVFGLLY